MESVVRVEVIHHAIGVPTHSGVSTLTKPPSSNAAATSPFVDLHQARFEMLETLVDNLSALLDLTNGRLDGHWKSIKQLETKLLEIDRLVKRHDAILQALVLSPKTRTRAQRAGLGPS